MAYAAQPWGRTHALTEPKIGVNSTVQPTTYWSPGITHITSAIPVDGENSILSGTGAYKNTSGSVRLSGVVNVSAFLTITFDRIFVLDLD